MDRENYLDVPFEVKIEDVAEDGTFEGYGSVFGGKPDARGDIVERGAFSKSLAHGGRNGNGVAMLWQHHSGEVPGVWTEVHEDHKGLYVKGQLILETTLGHDVYHLLKRKAVRGLSIGYDTIEADYNRDRSVRHLKEVEVWEVSPATFPMNTRARITGVKAIDVKAVEEATTERELEAVLRESGLSKNAAMYVVSMCRKSLRESSGDNSDGNREGLLTVLNSLRGVNIGLDITRQIQGF